VWLSVKVIVNFSLAISSLNFLSYQKFFRQIQTT
jgi:hypothetical protein